MADKIQLRRDLATNWTSADPVLAQGEEGHELDTGKRKIGDGTTAWTSLPYIFEGTTDHTALTNIGINTHIQIDSHISNTSNPHNVTATQVGLGNVDNTSDVDKPISTATQTALDLKYDASNPANYIDAAGAPVQSADIADFETTTQLNVRDTNNRNRANHTGSQVAATISDFDTEVSNNTSVTTNAGNISANSGNISTNTGNISANSTDITILQGEQTTQDAAIALNTLKVSADGSIGTHSDVDITGVATGDQLEWNGSAFVPMAILNGYTVFPIWAEESGGLSNGNRQWSYGNGATGNIGIPLGLDCELFAVSFQAETFGTSVSIDFEKNLTNEQTVVFNSDQESQNITAIPFSFGDLLTFQTNTENGAANDVRVCAWFRVQASAAFPTPDRSTTTATALSFVSTSFANIPGMSTTVNLSSPGVVDGIFNYSALRSGANNSEAQFRVVINGNNGTAYPDTLSTFNDNGSVSHFVVGLPAGTYTVLAQALVSQPTTITVCSLTATAVES